MERDRDREREQENNLAAVSFEVGLGESSKEADQHCKPLALRTQNLSHLVVKKQKVSSPG